MFDEDEITISIDYVNDNLYVGYINDPKYKGIVVEADSIGKCIEEIGISIRVLEKYHKTLAET